MCAVLRPSPRHDVSVAEYQRMIASGELPEDARFELIDGEIVDKEVPTPEHENAVRWLIRWLRANLSMDYDLLVAAPIERDRSQLEPDVMIVPYGPSTPRRPPRPHRDRARAGRHRRTARHGVRRARLNHPSTAPAPP